MTDPSSQDLTALEFRRRRDGMIHALDGGIWLHRHVWYGRAMAHVVSTDRVRLLAFGRALGLGEDRLQFKPLKDPRTGARRDAWHWDLGGRVLAVAVADMLVVATTVDLVQGMDGATGDEDR